MNNNYFEEDENQATQMQYEYDDDLGSVYVHDPLIRDAVLFFLAELSDVEKDLLLSGKNTTDPFFRIKDIASRTLPNMKVTYLKQFGKLSYEETVLIAKTVPKHYYWIKLDEWAQQRAREFGDYVPLNGMAMWREVYVMITSDESRYPKEFLPSNSEGLMFSSLKAGGKKPAHAIQAQGYNMCITTVQSQEPQIHQTELIPDVNSGHGKFYIPQMEVMETGKTFDRVYYTNPQSGIVVNLNAQMEGTQICAPSMDEDDSRVAFTRAELDYISCNHRLPEVMINNTPGGLTGYGPNDTCNPAAYYFAGFWMIKAKSNVSKVCRECKRHEADIYECCGSLAWIKSETAIFCEHQDPLIIMYHGDKYVFLNKPEDPNNVLTLKPDYIIVPESSYSETPSSLHISTQRNIPITGYVDIRGKRYVRPDFMSDLATREFQPIAFPLYKPTWSVYMSGEAAPRCNGLRIDNNFLIPDQPIGWEQLINGKEFYIRPIGANNWGRIDTVLPIYMFLMKLPYPCDVLKIIWEYYVWQYCFSICVQRKLKTVKKKIRKQRNRSGTT